MAGWSQMGTTAALALWAGCQGNSGVMGTRIDPEPAGSAIAGEIDHGEVDHVELTASGLPKLAEQGGLSFEIIDDATGQRTPGKLTLVGAKARARWPHTTACSRSPGSASSPFRPGPTT